MFMVRDRSKFLDAWDRCKLMVQAHFAVFTGMGLNVSFIIGNHGT